MKHVFILFLIFLMAACARAPEGVPLDSVDPARLTIYHGGTILTMEDAYPTAEAIAIRGEKIEAVGSDVEILALAHESAVRIDLAGRTLMPGFVDAHTHLLNDHRSQGLSLDEAQVQALRNGITTLGTLYVDRGFLNEIQAFASAGYLRVRTGLYLVSTNPCGGKLGDWWKAHSPTREPGEMLRINGVKIFTDGGSCGRVALSFELEPGWGTGDLWFTDEELVAMIAEVDAAGYQAAVHAIGDRAVVQSLDALETVLAGQSNTLRHRMEHVSVIPPEQIPRFGRLGVSPVLLGEFPNCTPYGPPVPEAFGHMEWPWRALREANPDLPLAWHSDVPFQSINPFDHILGFVTRIDLLGRAVCPPADWLLENTLTVAEALSIMTIQSAHALFRENEVGSLAPGKYADLIVLKNNPLEQEASQLADNHILLTVVGGRIEYCRQPGDDLCPGFSNRAPVSLNDTRPPVVVRWVVVFLIAAFPLAAMFARRRLPDLIRRVGVVAGLVGGASWAGIALSPEWVGETYFVILFMLPPFLMGLGTAGLASLWRNGRFGSFALWLSVLGVVAVSEGTLANEWFRVDWGWLLMTAGLLSHTIGLFLFGLTNLRVRVFRRWNGLPIILGLFGGPVPLTLSFVVGESSDLSFLMVLGVLGIGWILLSLVRQAGDAYK